MLKHNAVFDLGLHFWPMSHKLKLGFYYMGYMSTEILIEAKQILFVCVFAFIPSQQFFSHVEMISVLRSWVEPVLSSSLFKV